MIIAKGREIKEFSEIITIEQQITELTFTPKENMIKKIYIQTFNAKTGEALVNVLLRLRKSNSKISSEGLTKEQGDFSYIVDANCPHYLEVERKGYIPYYLEFNQTKGNEDDKLIKVPMFPVEKVKPKVISDPENQDEEIEIKPGYFRALLISDNEASNSTITLELHACITNPESNQDQEIVLKSSDSVLQDQNVKVKFTSHGEFGTYATIQTMYLEDQSKWYRLTARIASATLTAEDEFQLDQNFKNTLQDHNAKLMIFDEKKLISIVYAPSFITDMSTWDIGFINPSKGKFIKLNSCVDIEVLRKTHMRSYMTLFKFLNEEGTNFNLKSSLGFESDSCVVKLDDHVITDEKVFSKAVQKLQIYWISENIKDEEKMEERKYELSEFFSIFPNAFKNIFGEISLKRVISNLESHQGVKQASPQKLNRTISKTSRRIYF